MSTKADLVRALRAAEFRAEMATFTRNQSAAAKKAWQTRRGGGGPAPAPAPAKKAAPARKAKSGQDPQKLAEARAYQRAQGKITTSKVAGGEVDIEVDGPRTRRPTGKGWVFDGDGRMVAGITKDKSTGSWHHNATPKDRSTPDAAQNRLGWQKPEQAAAGALKALGRKAAPAKKAAPRKAAAPAKSAAQKAAETRKARAADAERQRAADTRRRNETQAARKARTSTARAVGRSTRAAAKRAAAKR